MSDGTDIPDDDRDESPDDHRADDGRPGDGRSDDHRPDDRRFDGSKSEDEGPDHWLSSLLSALESLESGATSRSGRRRGDHAVFDYDVSIRSGDDLWDDSRFDRPADETDRFGTDARDRPRTRRRRASPSSDHHLTTRRHDDELLVTADVAGSDREEVTVGFDDDTLVVAVEEREVDRIDVPWRERTADATIKNGVLTVQIRPKTNSSDDSGSTDETEPGTDDGGQQ